MSLKTIGIIGAMEIEIRYLLDQMVDFREEKKSDYTFYHGFLDEMPVILVQCGIGKVNAARCTQIMIDFYHPNYIVNTGIAGGVGDGLSIGDIVIGSELIQHDFDISHFGYSVAYIPGCGSSDKPSTFRSDQKLMNIYHQAICSLLPNEKVHCGTIVTGDLFVAESPLKLKLKKQFSALAAEMEGGAIAQTAVANQTPFLVIRAISDLADGTAPDSYAAFEQQTATLCAQMIEAGVRLLKSERKKE